MDGGKLAMLRNLLTDKEKSFVDFYLASKNGSDAYRRSVGNMELARNSAKAKAWRMKNSENVKNYIDEFNRQRYENLSIIANDILAELESMAFAEQEDAGYNASIKLKAIDLMQKQLGLQKQNIKADVTQEVTISVGIDDE